MINPICVNFPFLVINASPNYFCDSAGDIKVGATLLFFGFGSSTTGGSTGVSESRFCGIAVVAAGVSGGVLNGAADPVDDIDGFRFDP